MKPCNTCGHVYPIEDYQAKTGKREFINCPDCREARTARTRKNQNDKLNGYGKPPERRIELEDCFIWQNYLT